MSQATRAAIFAGLMVWPCLFVLPAAVGKAGGYTLRPGVNLRQSPNADARIIARLDHNRTLDILERGGRWLKVRDLTGRQGYVGRDLVGQVWIKVHKAERRLYLIEGGRAIKTYRIALSPANPRGDKVKRHAEKTVKTAQINLISTS